MAFDETTTHRPRWRNRAALVLVLASRRHGVQSALLGV